MYAKFLSALGRLCTEHYRKVLLASLLITLIMGGLAATPWPCAPFPHRGWATARHGKRERKTSQHSGADHGR